MSLWQLDGPTLITGLGPTNPIQISFGPWFPNVGLMMSSGLSTYGVTTLDGDYKYRASGNRWGNHWLSRKRLLTLVAETVEGVQKNVEWSIEPMAFLGTHSGPIEEALFNGGPAGSNYVRLDDRRLYVYFRTIHGVKDGIDTVEGPSLTGFPTSNVYSNPGRNDHEVFIACGGDNPVGVFYDTRTRAFSSPYIYLAPQVGLTCNLFTYVPEHNVFVSGYSVPHQIIIWAFEVRPTVLNPVEVVSGVVKSGQVVTYRTRVLGDQVDPAEGELVNWELEGSGTLLDLQSKADANGYATTRVEYGLAETGPSTVKANVVC